MFLRHFRDEQTVTAAAAADEKTVTVQPPAIAGMAKLLIDEIYTDKAANTLESIKVKVRPESQAGAGGGEVFQSFAASDSLNRNVLRFNPPIPLNPAERLTLIVVLGSATSAQIGTRGRYVDAAG